MQAAVQKGKGSNNNNNNSKNNSSNNNKNNVAAAGGKNAGKAAVAPAATAQPAVGKKQAAAAAAAAPHANNVDGDSHHVDPAATTTTTMVRKKVVEQHTAPHGAAAAAEESSAVTATTTSAAATSTDKRSAAAAAAPAASDATGDNKDKVAVDVDEEPQPHFPTPPPVDWSDSRLPSLFGCHNTAAMATSSAIPLHTAWELYADDHSGPNGLAGGAAGGGMGGGGGGASMHGMGLAPPSLSGGASLSFDAVHITTVADVQRFWRVWRYVTPPSACPIPYTYSWFRKDIKPEWEHARNKKGGTMVLVVFDRDRPGLNDKQALDDAFMATLLGAIGESFAESTTTLNGVMLKLRPNKPVTLHVWTAHSESGKLKAFANSLRATLSKVLGAKALQKIEYFSHHQNNQSHGAMGSLAARMKPKPKTTPDYTF